MSLFTRFYQAYILPSKFGIDKRRIHLSPLVLNGHLTREDALNKLDHIAYPSQKIWMRILVFLEEDELGKERLMNICLGLASPILHTSLN